MSVSAIILAAGISKRFKGNKLTAELKGRPLILHCIENALSSGVSEIIVVAGEEVHGKVQIPEGVRIVVNREPHLGMSHSIRIGLDNISADSDSVLILLGDMPGITQEIIDRLINLHGLNPGKIISSMHGGVAMVPALFPRKYFADLRSLRGDTGAKNFLRTSPDVVLIELDSKSLMDIDTRSNMHQAESDL